MDRATGTLTSDQVPHLLSRLLWEGEADSIPCSRASWECSSFSFLAAPSLSPALQTRQRLASEIRPCHEQAGHSVSYADCM